MKLSALVVTMLLLGGCAGIPYDAAIVKQPSERALREAINRGQLPTLGSQYRARVNPDGTVIIERY